MNYYVCIDTINEEEVLISTTEKAEKNDLIVYYDGSPFLATVLKSMDELTAITKYDGQFCEAIKVISMKSYLEKKAKESIESLYKVSFVDPIMIEEEIEKLDKEISDFKTEVDYVLSESNSTTFIEA